MKDYLVHRRIVLKPHHLPTGKTRHTMATWSGDLDLSRGAELQALHELVIARITPDPGYYLLYLDASGKEITDTYHETLEKAMEQAKWEFNVEANEWQTG